MKIRDVMTGEEFRAALGETGEKIINWFMTQERKLFNGSVVADPKDLIDKFMMAAGSATDLSIDDASELLSLLVVEYHRANIRKYSEQIPQKFKGVVDLLQEE